MVTKNSELSKKYYSGQELTAGERKLINVGPFRLNKVKCLNCEQVIQSTHRHDFKTYGCGSISVDGGSWYLKRCGDLDNYEEMSVKYKDCIKK